MDFKFFYTKQLHILKQKIDSLSERDRILVLFIIGVVLFCLWFFIVVRLEVNSKNEVNQKTQKLQEHITVLRQKEEIINILISHPDTARIIAHFKELTVEIAKLDKELSHHNERYITERDLAKLLHDMLKQTTGLVIESFGTIENPVVSLNQQTGTPPVPALTQSQTIQTPDPALALQTTHYRLVIRGIYFMVMNYLKRLEQLPWPLYWDKFDYTVVNYPEGRVTIDFYTLKPQGTQLPTKQGSVQ